MLNVSLGNILAGEGLLTTQINKKLQAHFSFEPRQKYSSPNKAVETIAINRVDAELELEAIEQAVNGIDDQLLRKIIYLKYLSPQKVRDKEIYMDMLYSETFFYNKLSEAIVCFAEIYRGGELLCWKIQRMVYKSITFYPRNYR